MTELEEEVVKGAVDLLYEYMSQKRTGAPWHDHGIGYALFGLEEKKLFLATNDDRHIVHFCEYGQKVWDLCTTSLADYPILRYFHILCKMKTWECCRQGHP